MSTLNVHFLPKYVEPEKLAGSTCVVIDTLRATTTIAVALDAGAREVIPCLEIEDARKIAAALPTGTCLLGGERGGKKIDGFDLGNSPAEYTPNRVNGKTLVFTTTNGTRAILHCKHASEILLGSLVNAHAIAQAVEDRSTINILCAGTDGEITREDVLTAGAIASLVTGIVAEVALNDEALIATDAWQSIISTSAMLPGTSEFAHYLATELRECRGGRNLIDLGMDGDLALATEHCSLSVVPVYQNDRITLRGDAE